LTVFRTSRKGSVVDLNLVVLAGRIAAEPEIRTFESGAVLVRLLLTVRSSSPHHRIDVVPVVQWNPELAEIPGAPLRGVSVWVVGSVQRRFWSVGDGRSSRIEVVAHEIAYRPDGIRIADEAPAAS
jgi:single-stranded DNA-binding protein